MFPVIVFAARFETKFSNVDRKQRTQKFALIYMSYVIKKKYNKNGIVASVQLIYQYDDNYEQKK